MTNHPYVKSVRYKDDSNGNKAVFIEFTDEPTQEEKDIILEMGLDMSKDYATQINRLLEIKQDLDNTSNPAIANLLKRVRKSALPTENIKEF